MLNMDPKYAWESSIFFEKRWIESRADKEKMKQAVLLYCFLEGPNAD
jgi:hypothetical protein